MTSACSCPSTTSATGSGARPSERPFSSSRSATPSRCRWLSARPGGEASIFPASSGSAVAATVEPIDPVPSRASTTHTGASPGTAMREIARSVSAGSSERSSEALASLRTCSLRRCSRIRLSAKWTAAVVRRAIAMPTNATAANWVVTPAS